MAESVWKVLLVEDNADVALSVRGMITVAGDEAFRVETADTMVRALNLLANETFDVVLLDLSLPDSHGLDTLATLQRYAGGTPVVVLTGLDSKAMALKAVAQGAQDYLVKGVVTPESLIRVMQYAVVRHKSDVNPVRPAAEKARVTGILGCKGGVGVTTIACHLSEEIKRQSAGDVLLVDLDPSEQSAAFLMRPKSEYTADEASTNLHRLDAQYWKRVVCTTDSGVDLLQSPGVVHFGHHLEPDRVRHVLRFVRGLYAHIVVDLGRPDPLSLALLQETTDLWIVTTLEIVSLYELAKLLRRLLESGIARDNLKLVANRAPRSASHAVRELEKAIGHPVFGLINECASELNEAYSDGRFLSRELRVHKDIAPLAAKSLGITPSGPSKNGLRFFGLARA